MICLLLQKHVKRIGSVRMAVSLLVGVWVLRFGAPFCSVLFEMIPSSAHEELIVFRKMGLS
jgi:hypothetical protein